MGCLALSYYEQGFPPFAGRSVFLSTAKAAQRCPQGNEKSCAGSYKFGFNGQEKVNEIAGIGNHTTALFWEYDTRIARRWNIDPVRKPWESPYGVLSLNPILNIDPLGDSDYKVNKSGKISLVKETDDETDRLIAVSGRKEKINYNKKGELQNASTTLDKGILGAKADYSKDKDGTDGWRLDFGDKTDQATKTFNFLADNTDVEYSLVGWSSPDGKSKRASVFTSHKADAEILGPKRVTKLVEDGGTPIGLINHTHNHPRDAFEPGFYGEPSSSATSYYGTGDREFYNSIWKLKPDTKFFIREKYITYPVAR